MSGERDLARLIAGMRPELDPVAWVFCTTTDPAHPARAGALMTFAEAEGLTLILPAEAAEPALNPVFRCRRITLTVHSALDAVGLLAAVTARLAALGMGVNPVSGWFHDHLFVPEDRADQAMAALRAMALEQEGGR